MYKAVVFDMDGVLVDTEKIYRRSWKINGMSIGITEQDMDHICDRVAGGNKASNARVFKDIMGEDFDYLAFRQRTMELFDEYVREHGVEIKAHVADTLKYLKDKGVKIALATSTERERAEKRLESVGILEYFDTRVCGDEVTRGKPNPDIYLKACEKLGVKPSDTVGVEDSVNGVIAAHSAGLFTVMMVDLIKPNEITAKNTDKVFFDMKELCSLF